MTPRDRAKQALALQGMPYASAEQLVSAIEAAGLRIVSTCATCGHRSELLCEWWGGRNTPDNGGCHEWIEQ